MRLGKGKGRNKSETLDSSGGLDDVKNILRHPSEGLQGAAVAQACMTIFMSSFESPRKKVHRAHHALRSRPHVGTSSLTKPFAYR